MPTSTNLDVSRLLPARFRCNVSRGRYLQRLAVGSGNLGPVTSQSDLRLLSTPGARGAGIVGGRAGRLMGRGNGIRW
jgi:hypothetical protein